MSCRAGLEQTVVPNMIKRQKAPLSSSREAVRLGRKRPGLTGPRVTSCVCHAWWCGLGRALSLHEPPIPHQQQEHIRGQHVASKPRNDSLNPHPNPTKWAHDRHPHFTDAEMRAGTQTQEAWLQGQPAPSLLREGGKRFLPPSKALWTPSGVMLGKSVRFLLQQNGKHMEAAWSVLGSQSSAWNVVGALHMFIEGDTGVRLTQSYSFSTHGLSTRYVHGPALGTGRLQ